MKDNAPRRKHLTMNSPKWRSEYELYVMRHGEAIARGTAGYSDETQRPLTPEGKNEVRKIAQGLRRLGVALDWVVSSPLVRAVETAQVIAELLASGAPVEFSDTLSPGGSAEALLAFLAKHPDRKRTLVVGHEPGLGEFAARLIGAGTHANFGFRKGGCCLIAFEEFPPRSPGRLVWWLTPRVLRKLA